MAEEQRACSACAAPLDAHNEGIELWGSWFCSPCFIGQASVHRELKPEEVELLRRVGRELAGFLPPELLEMILAGFHRRSSGSDAPPPKAELSRCVGEIQRLTAFACFRQVLNLLKTWQDMFNQFVQEQESEIRDKVRRLTELDGPR